VLLGASRAVRHAVLAVDISVLAGRNVVSVNRHGVIVMARDGRLVIEATRDALVLETTLAQDITLIRRIGALEARELVAAVGAEGASVEARPVVATLLLGRALVVGVRRAAIRLGADRPASGRHTLSRKARYQNNCWCEMHIG